ncbi:MAG: alpha-galactosidase, partial [Opitutales bacterium]|nr:alpha-galactosidase [Opitutales bacterium]
MKNIGLKIILKLALAAALLAPLCARAAWEVSFDESTSTLSAKNGGAELRGKLSFRAFAQNGDKWKIAASRDGVKDRLAIVDAGGDVQGYVVFPKKSDELQILFCHRTAQSYRGMMSLEARLSLGDKRDCFACRSTPKDGERVLNMALGGADSALNDSVFDAQNDLLVKMSAKNLSVKTAGAGEFAVKMSGEIGESAQARFGFDLERGYFKNSYVPYYKPLNRANVPKTPTGWMSWNTYFDKATAEDNLAEARIGKKYLQPFGCEIWSIESWQGNSDKLPVKKFHNMNLEVNERQFPEGMKKLAADIRALGFRPGLWVAPFGTGNAEFYKLHKDWFLHDKNGEPVRCWNGEYTLDPTVPEARKHLEGIFRKAAQDWGYEFFKIDGMSGRNKSYCAHLYERPEIRKLFKDPSCPNPFELCVKAFRDGIGSGSIFLACQGHTSGPEAAYAEMARTGADIVSPNKPVMWKNVLAQGRCTVNQLFAHNISMIADPDTLLVRDLDIEQARVSATIIALTGQLTFFGDKLAGLPPEKMKILQQTLPVELARPASLYPYFNMLPVW